jgi:hypothetical protein
MVSSGVALPFEPTKLYRTTMFVAGATNLIIGRAAYETARRLYPNPRARLRFSIVRK